MTVYVDPAVWKKPKGKKFYAHLVADTLEELHAFSETVGIKQHFFHSSAKWKHYDITSEQRDLAIAAGAIPITSKELVLVAKLMCTSEITN